MDELSKEYPRALCVCADIIRYEEVKATVEKAYNKYGSIDIMVNCAGGNSVRMLNHGREEFCDRTMEDIMNDEMSEKIKHLCADRVAVTDREDLVAVLKEELAEGYGVDVCIDCLGGDTVGKCLPYMNLDGRWIMIATLAYDFTNVNMRSMYTRRIRLIGTNLRSRTNIQKKEMLSEMAKLLFPKMSSGEIRPTVYRVFPAEQAEEAQALMQSGKSAGKIILRIK